MSLKWNAPRLGAATILDSGSSFMWGALAQASVSGCSAATVRDDNESGHDMGSNTTGASSKLGQVRLPHIALESV